MNKFTVPYSNFMMPFLWVHGEDERSYRRMIQAIDEASIKCFCIESRPHDDFLGEKWWRDLDIIIDEAKKRGMSFYILDDKHFPTGFANGAALTAPNELRRQSVFYKSLKVSKGESISIDVMDHCKLEATFNQLGKMMDGFSGNSEMKFDDDRFVGVSFISNGHNTSLKKNVISGKLEYTAEEDGEIALVYLTRNAGIHRSYINMMDPRSVRLLINETYEKTYGHYKDEFGKTIVGFFSDEPELGNSTYTNMDVDLGKDPNLDLPFSGPLEERLKEKLGDDWGSLLPLLWNNNGDQADTKRVRYTFSKEVAELVSKCFSKQIGDWCRERNVNYIGHVIEDNGLHEKTCSSLGHYFLGLKYQSMAGVDDIGGQVEIIGEDEVGFRNPIFFRDGAFYHYTLAKLASSLAFYSPLQKNRSFCEIFGNYGWKEGIKLEKYLLDSFMVRGVNHFVPHAFTCKEYPDPDCPPHFFAYGNNPQYRHFGKLMEYGNRICSLLNENAQVCEVAILYEAESRWCGNAQSINVVAKELYDSQIDYMFMPADVLEDTSYWNTTSNESLIVNGHKISTLIIPSVEAIPTSVAELINKGIVDVICVDGAPKYTCEGKVVSLQNIRVVSLENLAKECKRHAIIELSTPFRRLRVSYYSGSSEFYFLSNEDQVPFDGEISITGEHPISLYDAYEDKVYDIPHKKEGGMTVFHLHLEPIHTVMVLIGEYEAGPIPQLPNASFDIELEKPTHCRSIDYPNFNEEPIDEKFSGYTRYEATISKYSEAMLCIESANEAVEVFVNDSSLGIKLVAPFLYDLTGYLTEEENRLRIEVASTLEAERSNDKDMAEMFFGFKEEKHLPEVGITGRVRLHYKD